MTPDWIHSKFTITGPFTLYPQYYEIPAGAVTHQQTLQLQLISPGILPSTDGITVTITVAMDTEVAQGDHDPGFGISDRKLFIGFRTPDKGNYHKISPCHGLEADINNKILTNHNSISTVSLVKSRNYSSEIRLQIRPKERWGSCHTEHDEGYTNTANYQHKLDLGQGLYFEMYHAGTGERYRIKYIKVDIELD